MAIPTKHEFSILETGERELSCRIECIHSTFQGALESWIKIKKKTGCLQDCPKENTPPKSTSTRKGKWAENRTVQIYERLLDKQTVL